MIEEIPFILIFDGSKSVFRIKRSMGVGDQSSTYNQLISMLPKTYIDIENKVKYDYAEISGQPFLVKDTLNTSWKIVNKKKLIKGYNCIKAIQLDDKKNIVTEAWFAPEIPLSIGPASHAGLPGLLIATRQFNKNGEAYAGYELVDIDVSKQKKVTIPDYDTMTLNEFTNFMKGSKSKFN